LSTLVETVTATAAQTTKFSICIDVYSYVWVSGSGNPQKAQAGAIE